VTADYAPGSSPAGYLPLSLFGIAPIAGVGDETISNFNVPAFTYAGETYSRIGIVSNGYVVIGGGTAGDVQYVNSNFPSSNPPNNVLAPFWTDLNPGAGGAMRIGVLTGGGSSWIIVDWENVKNYSSAQTNSFQIWIGINGTEDITYAYGPVSGGDLGYLTVGAENRFGSEGQAVYFDGVGTAPANGNEVLISGVPGAPGETKTFNFKLKAVKKGNWNMCAYAAANTFQGESVACIAGSNNW
jgi:hypothetical protein